MKIMRVIKSTYEKYSESNFLNIWIYTAFASALFSLKIFGEPTMLTITVGVVLIALLTFHGALLKAVKDEELIKIDYFKKRLARQYWLINSINKLVKDKTVLFRESIGVKIPDGQREESIRTTLQMIYQFYSSSDYSNEPSGIRIVFQEPRKSDVTGEQSYLSLTYSYFGDGRRPEYEGDIVKEKQYFTYDRCPPGQNVFACPVSAWVNKEIVVYPVSDEIPYFCEGQKENVKSLVSYPVKGESDDNIIGVITISSSKENFFEKSDIKEHNKYIKEFSDRVVMELAAIEMKQLKEAS